LYPYSSPYLKKIIANDFIYVNKKAKKLISKLINKAILLFTFYVF
jgi:hypothetical protein